MKYRFRAILCAALLGAVGTAPATSHANTSNLARGVTIYYDVPEEETTVGISFPWRTQLEFQESLANIYRLQDQNLLISAKVIRDPSVAYRLQFTNTSTDPEPVSLTIGAPVEPLQANSISAELVIELVDSNGNGSAFLNGNYGPGGAIQAATIYNSAGGDATALGPALGTNISAPGVHTFTLPTTAGPVPAEANQLDLATRFILSPGDTVYLSSRFVIDEGTGIPLAEVPDFPDPSSGPFFNVIDVDSPETSIAANEFIGSQTQLNLSAGGSIGNRFNFDAYQNNRVNDNNKDVEINITGGTVGNQFMALGGTTVNVSGGTMEGIVLVGSYSNQSQNAKMNISGGAVGAGLGGQIQAYAGSLVSISGGTVGNLNGYGGSIDITAGMVGNTAFPTSGGSIQVNDDDSQVNLIGGSFFAAAAQGSVLVLDGVLNASGGSFLASKHDVDVYANGAMNLFGTAFSLNGVAISGLVYGQTYVVTDRDVTLSGVLADGATFSIELNSVNDPFGPDFVSPDASLTVTLSLPGDYNNDGAVDAADYTVWRDNLGSEVVLSNDTSPGRVTELDYEVWKGNFGRVWSPGGSAAEAANAPEPTSAMLFCLALCGLATTRYVRGRS